MGVGLVLAGRNFKIKAGPRDRVTYDLFGISYTLVEARLAQPSESIFCFCPARPFGLRQAQKQIAGGGAPGLADALRLVHR